MSATIDATVGGAAANSYNLESELDTLAAELFPEPVSWTQLPLGDNSRLRAMITATRRLDQESFPRARVDQTQVLEWPRAGVTKPETGGYYIGINLGGAGGSVAFYLTTEIPQAVKTAQAQLAFFLLDQAADGVDPFLPSESAGVKSENFGGELQTDYEDGATMVTPGQRFMARVIRPYLSQFGLIYAPQVSIVRG